MSIGSSVGLDGVNRSYKTLPPALSPLRHDLSKKQVRAVHEAVLNLMPTRDCAIEVAGLPILVRVISRTVKVKRLVNGKTIMVDTTRTNIRSYHKGVEISLIER